MITQYRRKKLYYRSIYRGSREMDLIMRNFTDQYLEQMSEAELDEFEQLLHEEDDVLYQIFVEEKFVVQNKYQHLQGKLKDTTKHALQHTCDQLALLGAQMI